MSDVQPELAESGNKHRENSGELYREGKVGTLPEFVRCGVLDTKLIRQFTSLNIALALSEG